MSCPRENFFNTSSAFGLLLPGRPLRTDVVQVDADRWTISIGSAPQSFSVFLTNATGPLAAVSAIGIYAAREADHLFEYVGYLTQDYPTTVVTLPSSLLSVCTPVAVVVGFCLQTRADIANMESAASGGERGSAGMCFAPNAAYCGGTGTPSVQQAQAATKCAMAEKILGEFYNFVMSYGRSVNPGQPLCLSVSDTTEDYVLMPGNFVDKWRERMRTKIEKDSAFWTS
ncbi:hypothetical protein STCU_06983 [Strigomonas culicis]|uniref:Hikeshi-like C-terminal domain-containing protein n=1 Tax=Strigomonas culicis TaxID=28005 RepID=S9VNH8_9TRYP|nr:hypothetical protein STCU_06983 [Strigomonas culicis]|eukprot:EPY24830.1 hypothetical protein STCU_06983 [Strigomonas culicis]